jgi:hypothetical protein
MPKKIGVHQTGNGATIQGGMPPRKRLRVLKERTKQKRKSQPMVKIVSVPVIRLNKKAQPQDYARAHASTILSNMDKNNFGPATDEVYSPPAQGGWNDDGGSNAGITTGSSGGGNSGGGAGWLDVLDKIGNTGGKVLDVVDRISGKRVSGVADSSAGKNATGADILAGLGESYIQSVVQKYRSGKALTEFERRVAEAAIGLEGYAKTKAKQKAGEWIIDHGLEIGIGAAILILLIFMLKR